METHIIKEKSILDFLKQNLLGEAANEIYNNRSMQALNVHHFLGNELFLKKDCGIKPGDTIDFETKDFIQGARTECVSIYTYICEKYDDFGIKLIQNKVDLKS